MFRIASQSKGMTAAAVMMLVHEEDESLLDRTMVLYITPMSSSNSHRYVKLPVLLAGGGFKHGQHLGFDKDNNHSLANLCVPMLPRPGIHSDKFATSNGTMRGLEITSP